MVDGAHFAFRAASQIGIELFRLRDRFLGDFIDGRGRGLLFAETVAGAEGLELVQAHRVDNVVVQGAQLRVGIEIESARQQLVERLIEFLARFYKMAGLEILLARVERGLTLCRKLLRPIGQRLNHKRPQNFVLGINWQRRQNLVLRWQSDLRWPDLYRRLGRIFTTSKAEKNTGSNEEPTYRFLIAISHGVYFWTDWTDDRHCPPQ